MVVVAAINRGAELIQDGVSYLRENAMYIALLLALWFYARPRVLSAMEDLKTRRSPDQVKDYDRDLRRVREMQQLQAAQEAKEKAKELQAQKEERLRQEKLELKEKKKKIKAKTNTTKAADTSNLSMNSFSTPSYRPQRRTVRRG